MVEADAIAVIDAALRLRLAQPDGGAGPAQVPDRLAALSLDLRDGVEAERDERDDRALDHHYRAGEALIGERGKAEQPLLVGVDGVEDAPRPEKHVPEDRLHHANGRDVAQLRTGAEPLGRGERLEHGQPHDRAAGEEAEVLERVHRVVAQGGVVEVREVPHIEVDRPERQRHQRVSEEAETVQPRERRPQDRSRQSGEERERREIAEQHVLQHVEREHPLAECVHRRNERYEQREDPEREQEDPPARHGRPALAQRQDAARVQCSDDERRHDLKRVERPARGGLQVRDHVGVHLFHYHLVTSKVREVEARYLGKLGFTLVARHGRIGEDTTSFEAGYGWEDLDRMGFKLRLSELERGAVNVVVQPGPWGLPRVDHLGFARDEDEFAATIGRAELRELRIQEHGGRRTFVSTNAGYRVELHPPREWLDELLEHERDLRLAELHLRADDPREKAAALGELLAAPYTADTVELGDTLVRFVPDGPQGRPQLHAELFA